jgi:hypothetical protein
MVAETGDDPGVDKESKRFRRGRKMDSFSERLSGS